MSRAADMISSVDSYYDLSSSDKKYLIDNPDEVAEFIRLEEGNWTLWHFLEKHPHAITTSVLQDLVISAIDPNFRYYCAQELEHCPSPATENCLRLALRDFDSGVRSIAVDTLAGMGVNTGYSSSLPLSGTNPMPKPMLAELIENFDQYQPQGYHILLSKLGSQYSQTWDGLSGFSSRDEVKLAIDKSPDSFKDSLLMALEKATSVAEILHLGRMNFGSGLFIDLENLLFLCAHAFSGTDSRSPDACALGLRILRAEHPLHPPDWYAERTLSKYYDERYASFRHQALIMCHRNKEDVEIATAIDVDAHEVASISKENRLHRLRETLGVNSRCNTCGDFLDNPSRHWSGMVGQQLIDECVNRTNDQDRRVRKKAAKRLVDEMAMDELFDLLDHYCEYVTGIVVRGLKAMPTTDYSNIDRVLEPNNNSMEKRLAALSLLTNIDNPVAIMMIEGSLNDSEPRIQHAAVNQVGATARKALTAKRYRLLGSMIDTLERVNPLNNRINEARDRLLGNWYWSRNESYGEGDIVFHGGGLYISQQTGNTNQEPLTGPVNFVNTYWRPVP
jgi:hypothetical protein